MSPSADPTNVQASCKSAVNLARGAFVRAPLDIELRQLIRIVAHKTIFLENGAAYELKSMISVPRFYECRTKLVFERSVADGFQLMVGSVSGGPVTAIGPTRPANTLSRPPRRRAGRPGPCRAG
jgi:hypothetical protein